MGTPMCGSPLGTGPRIEMSCAENVKTSLRMIIPTTATRPPGITLIQRPKTIRIASTATETSAVCHAPSPMCVSVRTNLRTLPLKAWLRRSGAGTPSMPADLPDRDLHADAREEPDQHGAREEVGEEPEPGDPCEQHQPADEQRADARQPDPLRGVRLQRR